jgi:cytochrome c
MIRRWTMALAVALALAAGTASAGGWATVTLDEVPAEARAGETLELGFVVRQHGRTPVDTHTWEGRMPVLTATHAASGETVIAEARKSGAEGHYTVSVTFPRPGEWAWQIAPEPFAPTLFEPLSVASAAPAASRCSWPRPRWPSRRGAHPVRLFGRRSSSGGGMLRLSALLAAGGLAMLVAALVTSVGPGEGRTDRADRGRALFAGKGCAMCHSHGAIARSGQFAGETGSENVAPDLTDRPLDAEYLRRWLRDPQSMRPGTTMPNLALSEDEIDALVAFLRASD